MATNSKVYARNTMAGDTYVMRGEPNATIVDSITYVTGGTPQTTVLAIRDSEGAIRVRTVTPDTRIVIRETTSSRDRRRAASREASRTGVPVYGTARFV